MNTDTEPKRSAFSHTVTAENGMVTVCRNGVPIYSFKADLVEEMAIEPRKLAGHGTPCAVLILRGAGPGGILFETHELAAEAMRMIDGAKSDTRPCRWHWVPITDGFELTCVTPDGVNWGGCGYILHTRGGWYAQGYTRPGEPIGPFSAAKIIVDSLRKSWTIRPHDAYSEDELSRAEVTK